MSDSIEVLLGYEARSRVISNFQFQNLALSQFFIQPTVTERIDGKIVEWDVNIADREAGLNSAHGTPAHSINLSANRKDRAVCLRDYRKKDIPGDVLNQIRAEGSTTKQEQGRQQIVKEQRALAKNIAMNKELHLIKTLTPGNQTYTTTDGRGTEMTVTINQSIPAGNTLTIGASWATAGTDILADIQTAKTQVQAQSGMDIRHAWCNSTFKAYFLKNDDMVALMGGTNAAVSLLRGSEDVVIDGIMFHFYDGTYTVGGTVTKFCPDELIWFHPDLSPDWFKWTIGTELISVDGRMRENLGLGSWTKLDDDPAGIILYALDNYFGCLTVPGAVAYADVVP